MHIVWKNLENKTGRVPIHLGAFMNYTGYNEVKIEVEPKTLNG